MGSGKSLLGNELASNLGMELLDTDFYIEQMTGMSIAALWTKHGEQYFRVLERQVCLMIKEGDNGVIATGGGLPVHSFTIDEMKKSGKVVYLEAKADVLWSRVQANKATRPLAMVEDSFNSRLFERKPIYESADVVLDATLPLAKLAAQVLLCLDS